MFDYTWLITKDGDPRVSDIYKRHYSCYQYADKRRSNVSNRQRHLVMGPGEKLILLTPDIKAIFGWRKFYDASGQKGVNCAFFRNEGAFGMTLKSSELILAAEQLARQKWGELVRLYTYVAESKVKSTNPGYCFQIAGWEKTGRTKSGLIILSKNTAIGAKP